MMFLAVIFLITVTFFTPSSGYRSGAREESCYNHTVNHGGGVFFGNCVPSTCRYFLVIKEVVNETTLELGNVTNTYECGKIYGIEVANNLNSPEGFLVQARNGTSDSSEIIGTFLHPDDVSQRTGNTQVNYRILQCRRSEAEDSTSPLLDNSATHPDTVNMAGTLQLFWQAPECNNDPCTKEYDYPNITVWFTIVQQLLLVFNPSKTTVLTYKPPPAMPMPTSCIMAMPSTSMVTSVAPLVSTSKLPPISVDSSTASTAEATDGTSTSIQVQQTALPPPPPTSMVTSGAPPVSTSKLPPISVSSAATSTAEGMDGTSPQPTTPPPPTSMVTSVAPPVSTSKLPPISVSSAATATAEATDGTPPSIPVQPTTPPPPPAEVLSPGAIIGIGAGGGVLAVILLAPFIILINAVVVHVYSSRKKNSNAYKLSPSDPFALNGTNENGSKTNDSYMENDVCEKSDPEEIDQL